MNALVAATVVTALLSAATGPGGVIATLVFGTALYLLLIRMICALFVFSGEDE